MQSTDRNGTLVHIGTRVRVLCLTGQCLADVSALTRREALSMVGEVYEVEDIDKEGHPWIRKSWEDEDRCASYEIAIELEPHEMEVVDEGVR